jgi:hypothetical protein
MLSLSIQKCLQKKIKCNFNPLNFKEDDIIASIAIFEV